MDEVELRYADGPGTEESVSIAAPPATVWALVTDINLPARFSTEFQGAEWSSEANGPALGATFVGRNKHPAAGEWETTSTICGYEPERLFEWAVGDPDRP